MQKYTWDSIRGQEFSVELKWAYKKVLEEKQEELEVLRIEEQELKNMVARAVVHWKLSSEFDKNLQTKTGEMYEGLGKALEKYEQYKQDGEKISRKKRLKSEIEWLKNQLK